MEATKREREIERERERRAAAVKTGHRLKETKTGTLDRDPSDERRCCEMTRRKKRMVDGGTKGKEREREREEANEVQVRKFFHKRERNEDVDCAFNSVQRSLKGGE